MSYIFWLSVAVVLLIIEIVAPAFFFVFFAFSGLVVAALSFFGLLADLAVQITIFSLLAIASLALLRRKFMEGLKSPGLATSMGGESLTVDNDIPSKGEAQISYQGSVWTALNSGADSLKKGDKAYIVRTEGVRLILLKAD